jgi:tetratricopeptide (TPR) repeat protein
MNVEHLLDVFTSIDANSDDVWDTCTDFMEHLFCHKKRLIMLRPKIEGLPDDHRSKPGCLVMLSQLLYLVGNCVESKQLLIHTLKHFRERGNDHQVALMLDLLAHANLLSGLYKEGIQQAEEALEIHQRCNNVSGQAYAWQSLALLFCQDNQLSAAEEAASRSIDLLSGDGS